MIPAGCDAITHADPLAARHLTGRARRPAMDLKPLPFDATLEQYGRQAQVMLDAYRSGDAKAVQFFRQHHPRFLRSDIPWLSKNVSDSEIQSAALETADARVALARWY